MQAKETSGIIQEYEDIIKKEHLDEPYYGESMDSEAFPITRSRNRSDTTVNASSQQYTVWGREVGGHETRTIALVLENNKIRWANVPKEPIAYPGTVLL